MNSRNVVAAVAVVSLGLSGRLGAVQVPAPQQIAYDYSALYDTLNPSIVKVFADGSSGSGFLVSESGLIATNHHVVRNSRFLAVQFADGRKVAAAVVTLDPQYDLAILKVNVQVAAGLKALALLPADRDREVRAGTPVLAFGSPLSQTFMMTQGIVAKVEESVLLGDFLIQPGNSGGPLVTLKGEVAGVNTFAERAISGAVRVTALRRVLASSAVTGYDRPDPAAALLPTAPADRYPTELLKQKIISESLDASAYRLDAGKFTITAMTPVLVGKSVVQDDLVQARNRLIRRGKKVDDPTWREVDSPFYEWTRSATAMLDNVVTFEIKPDFGATTGSKWAMALSAIAAGLNRRAMGPVHQNVEFKAEFLDFRLYRDGQLVAPIHPGRAITEASLDEAYLTFVDEAYSGMYSYAPDVFRVGNSYRVEVFDAREPGKPHASIPLPGAHPLIQQLRRDFVEVGTNSTTPVAVPLPRPGPTTSTSNPTEWATNLPGLSAQLLVAGDNASLKLTGTGDLAGIDAFLRKTPIGFFGSYQACQGTATIELRQITNGWQGSIVRVDCKITPPQQIRTGLLLTRPR